MTQQAQSTLVAHSGAHKVTFDDLKALPTPEALGPQHTPMRHDIFVDELSAALIDRGYEIKRSEYAISAKGAKMFGIMDLFTNRSSVLDGLHRVEGVGLALGFRHANDKSMGYRMVAGARVFVCDNMALSGETPLLSCKHLRSVDVRARLVDSVDHLTESYMALDRNLLRLSESAVTISDAKAWIYDAFLRDEVMAVKYLPEVHQWFFNPKEEAPDCAARTLWGIHNAFTRTIKGIESPAVRYEALNAVGAYFDLARK